MVRSSLVVLVLVACRSEDPTPGVTLDTAATPSDTSTPASPESPDTSQVTPTPRDSIAPPPTAVVVPGAAAQARAAMEEARALSKAGRHAEAFARLEPHLAGTDLPPPYMCEAGFIAFRAGRIERALPLIRTAAERYLPPRDEAARVGFARCLFNVGLVSEAAGDVARAVEAFQRSFDLRANKTVYEHLVAASLRLDAAADAQQATDVGAIVDRAIGPSPRFEDLAAGLTDYCLSRRYHPQHCTASVSHIARSSSGLEAAFITSVDPAELYLAVSDKRGARLIGSLGDARVGDNLLTTGPRWEDLLPSASMAGEELVIDLEHLVDESMPGGNDCDPDEPGCLGTTARAVRVSRVLCADVSGELGCALVPVAERRFKAPVSGELPCDADGVDGRFGVGWRRDLFWDASARLSTTTHDVEVSGRACEGQALPANGWTRDDVPAPSDLRAAPFTDLVAGALRLERAFPTRPRATVPEALRFSRPWSPPWTALAASEVAASDDDALARRVAQAWWSEEQDYSPRCCPYGGDCEGKVKARADDGAEALVVVDVLCTGDIGNEDARATRILMRGVGADRFAVLGVLDRVEAAGEARLPAIKDLRFEELLATPGLEARFSFEAHASRPEVDARTKKDVEVRSTTRVEVLCTSGANAACWGFPVAYDGQNIVAAAAGGATVVDRIHYKLSLTVRDDALEFSVVDGSAPTGDHLATKLVGRHRLDELTPFRLHVRAASDP